MVVTFYAGVVIVARVPRLYGGRKDERIFKIGDGAVFRRMPYTDGGRGIYRLRFV